MKVKPRHGFLSATILALVLSCAGVARAQAPVIEGEQPGQQGFAVNDPSVIARCLCGARHVSNEKGLLDRLGAEFQAAKSHVAATSAALARARSLVKPDDAEQLDAYRRLLEESQRADRELHGTIQPAYAAQVERYNQSVESYNAACAGMPMDGIVEKRVEENLTCESP
jgi:hypothetical protein